MKEQKKIAFYASNVSPESRQAVGVRCGLLINELRKTSLSVEVWSNETALADVPLQRRPPSNQSGFVKRLFTELAMGWEILIKIIWKGLNGNAPAVFVLSSPPYIVCLFAAVGCRISRVPYALDIRDLYPETFFSSGLIDPTGLHGKLQQFIVKSFYRNAIHIFTTTSRFAENIRAHIGNKVDITIVQNGFDENIFRSAEIKNKSFTCVCHGNLGHLQNIELLIEVARVVQTQNPDIKFVVAGSGPKQSLFAKNPLPNLEFLGSIAYAEIAPLLSSAHIGLSFRHDDLLGRTAFPVKAYEYIGSGLPIILSPKGEAGETIEEFGFGRQFNNEDVKSISAEILRLASDPEEYSKVRNRILNLRSQFSRQASAKIFAEKVSHFEILGFLKC